MANGTVCLRRIPQNDIPCGAPDPRTDVDIMTLTSLFPEAVTCTKCRLKMGWLPLPEDLPENNFPDLVAHGGPDHDEHPAMKK